MELAIFEDGRFGKTNQYNAEFVLNYHLPVPELKRCLEKNKTLALKFNCSLQDNGTCVDFKEKYQKVFRRQMPDFKYDPEKESYFYSVSFDSSKGIEITEEIIREVLSKLS